MATLNWIGKEAVVNHDKEVPFKLLKKVPSASVGKESKNLIVHGDNLEALKALMPFYKGKVKCIYIDPPYNTGNEKWTYNDKVNSPKIREWLGKVVGGDAEDLTRHDKWLCMMYPRLKLLRELLSEDGAIYMQLDYNEVHYGKLLMDEIFGRDNFQREIIWRIGWISGFKSADANWVRNHDTILFYSKNAKKLEFIKQYNKPEEYLERFNGETTKALAQYFQDLGLDKKATEKAIKYAATVGLPDRYPLEDTWNASVYDKLNSIAIVSFSGEKVSKLLNVEEFKGQKSIELVKRIIRAHTKEDDIVLDSFAGTGSTGHAVLDLNKEDGQHRKFILVEMDDHVAEKITSKRLKKNIEKSGYKDSFEYCDLAEPLFDEKGQINVECSYDELATYIYFTETQTNLEKKTIKKPFIGESHGTSYYLIYAGKDKNDLTRATIEKLKLTGPAVIYADRCLVDEDELEEKGIVFKQIPYEIKVY